MTALDTITVSRFPTAFPGAPAYGVEERITWPALAELMQRRREGPKDGPCFVPARFNPEPDGRVRRLIANVLARTAIALDCETSKTTGEIPPSVADAAARVKAQSWACAIYTSHNHTAPAPRYRIVLPMTAPILPTLPAVEVIAAELGVTGVMDMSKIGPASLFYLPSAGPGHLADHETVVIDGAPICATWMEEQAGAILAAREAEQARQRAEALAAAEQRRAERIAAGLDPDASIIEAVRNRLDLVGELLRHGYRQMGDRFLFAGSETGIAGVHVLRGNDGVERAYSHHAGDPLAPGNLPNWCRSKVVDAVDVVAILDHGGDLTAALRTLANRFGIEGEKRKWGDGERAVGRIAGRLIRERRPSAEVRIAALAEAAKHNIDATRAESITQWIAGRELARRGG